jgi:putative ABC transport system substrate-binding protein
MNVGRRDFITLLGGATAAAWPLAGRAQQPTVPVVGLLQGADYDDPILTAALRLGLSQSGFVEGKSVTIEYRDAHGQYDRLPAMADELVRRQVAVIGTVTRLPRLPQRPRPLRFRLYSHWAAIRSRMGSSQA